MDTTFVFLQCKDKEGEIIIRLHNIYLLRRLNSFPEAKNPFSTAKKKKNVLKAYFFIIRFKIMINQNQNQNLRMEGGTDRHSQEKSYLAR